MKRFTIVRYQRIVYCTGLYLAIFLWLGSAPSVVAQRSFKMPNETGAITQEPPSGNSIGVITTTGDTVFIAAGSNLNITTNAGAAWNIIGRSDGLYKGSPVAITHHKSVLYVTTAYDSSLAVEPTYGVSGGISISKDFGNTWSHIAQPTDTGTIRGPVVRTDARTSQPIVLNLVRDVMRRQTGFLTDSIYVVAIKSEIDNITFDIAVNDSSIWLAAFAGGLRRARIALDGTIGYFTPMPLPPDSLLEIKADRDYDFSIDPLEHYNHRVFSVISARDGIWCGSAGGINFSSDFGQTWKRYTSDQHDISGNFVTALAEQFYTESGSLHRVIWAGTNRALSSAEESGVSFTTDSGATWQTSLRGNFVNNITFGGKTVYVATSDGLFRSSNLGQSWERLITIIDQTSGDRIFTSEFTTIGVTPKSGTHTIFAGTYDGLGISTDDGVTWTIPRAYAKPGQKGNPSSYAYPNPFSPKYGIIRFQFDKDDLSSDDRVTLSIYDFSMTPVVTLVKNAPIEQTIFWNGTNQKGQRVANGTYIYIIEAGKKKFHGKVTVRN